MFGKTKFIVAGVLVLVLLAAGIGGTIALAQGPTPTPPASTGAKTLSDLYLQALAQKLGTTVDKLQQAMTDARKDALNQAVKQGLLTQAQADNMLQMQNAIPGAPFGNFGLRGGNNSANNVRTILANVELDAAAKALGMTSADLTTALRGKTLLALAGEKNVDVTKLRTAIADAEKAALDQAVKDGKIAQAQADSLKANIKPENIDLNRRSLNVPGNVPGRSGIGMPGGMNGRPNGQFGRK